jgi:hypothetical protein
MRRLVALLLFVGGPLLLLSRRRQARRDSVSLHYGDGSIVTLDASAPGFERLVSLARQAL